MENYKKFIFLNKEKKKIDLQDLYDAAQVLGGARGQKWLDDISNYYELNINSLESDGTYNNYSDELISIKPLAGLNLTVPSLEVNKEKAKEFIPKYGGPEFKDWLFTKGSKVYTLHQVEMEISGNSTNVKDLDNYVRRNLTKYQNKEHHDDYKAYKYYSLPISSEKLKVAIKKVTEGNEFKPEEQVGLLEIPKTNQTEIYMSGLIKESDIAMLKIFSITISDNYSFNTIDYSKFCDKMILNINVDFLNFLKESKFEGFDPRELFKMIVSKQNKDLSMEQISSDMLRAVGLCLLRGPNIDSIERRSNATTKKFVQDLKVRYNLRTRGKDNKDPTMMRLISTFPYLSQIVHLYMMDNDLDRYVTLEDIPSILKPILHPGLVSLVDISTQVGLLMAMVYTIYQVGITMKVTKKPKSFSETFKDTIPYVLAALNGSIATRGQRVKFINALIAINFLSSEMFFSFNVAKAIMELLNKKLRNLGLHGIQDVNNIVSKFMDGMNPELSLLGDLDNKRPVDIKLIKVEKMLPDDDDLLDY